MLKEFFPHLGKLAEKVLSKVTLYESFFGGYVVDEVREGKSVVLFGGSTSVGQYGARV